MPYVNIKITKEGATVEQKAHLIKEVTQLIHNTLNRPIASTIVVIEEVEMDNWGVAGETVRQRRAKGK